MKRGDVLSRVNPKYLPQINAQLATMRKGPPTSGTPAIEAAPKQRRLRQSRKPLLNKLETEWLSLIQVSHAKDGPIRSQAVRLRLANGDWYKPDFVVTKLGLVYEVKGPKAFRGGLEFLKIAASQFPEFRFVLVWKIKGEWMKQEVLS